MQKNVNVCLAHLFITHDTDNVGMIENAPINKVKVYSQMASILC